jgi:hypothetical protein
METYEGVNILIHVFFTSALFGGEWSASRSGRFASREKAPGTHWIGGWVGSRTGLNHVERRNCNPSVIQPVESYYTECAIPVREINRKFENF